MVGLQGDNIQTENNDHCLLILFPRHNHYVFEGHKMVIYSYKHYLYNVCNRVYHL
ncbi:hypothetical protein ESCOCP334M_24345 [Escherichia coli]